MPDASVHTVLAVSLLPIAGAGCAGDTGTGVEPGTPCATFDPVQDATVADVEFDLDAPAREVTLPFGGGIVGGSGRPDRVYARTRSQPSSLEKPIPLEDI